MDYTPKGSSLAAQITAIISVTGSFISLLSFYICPQWRKKLFTLNLIYFSLSISNLLELQNFIIHPTERNEYCEFQAFTMQFFWISSWTYECILAVETTILIHTMKRSNSGLFQNNMFLSLPFRNLCYQIITILFSIGTSVYIILSSDYSYLESWCWLKSPKMRLYIGYIPIWIDMLIIIICDTYVFWIVYQSVNENIYNTSTSTSSSSSVFSPNLSEKIDQRTPNSSIDSASQKVNSKRVYLHRQIFIRFAIGPFLMILLHIPGSLLRFSQAANIKMSPSSESFWSFAQAICDPLHGTINAIVWVLTDKTALHEWSIFFSQIIKQLFGDKIQNSKFNIDTNVVVINPIEELSPPNTPRMSHTFEISDEPIQKLSELSERRSSLHNPVKFLSWKSIRNQQTNIFGNKLNQTTQYTIDRPSGEYDSTNHSSRISEQSLPSNLIYNSTDKPQFMTFESEVINESCNEETSREGSDIVRV